MGMYPPPEVQLVVAMKNSITVIVIGKREIGTATIIKGMCVKIITAARLVLRPVSEANEVFT